MLKKMNELTKQQIRRQKIDRSRLIKGSEKCMYIHEVIAINIVMQTRLSKPKKIKYRSDLGFNPINLILKNELSEKIKLQHSALENERVKTDMHFSEYELVVEIDKKGHINRNQNKENERQTKIEKRLNCVFHRTNPDAENFDIFVEISKIQKLHYQIK